MDESNSVQSNSSSSPLDVSQTSMDLTINDTYPGCSFSFHAKNPKIESSGCSDSGEDEYKRECEKLARKNYNESHRDFSQRHFEQACAIDKQLLWLAGAAIGLPIAYLGQAGFNHISYNALFVLFFAWFILLTTILLLFKSMGCGNAAFEFNLSCLKPHYLCESEGKNYETPQNKAAIEAQKFSAYAKKLLTIGVFLLLIFFRTRYSTSEAKQ